MNTDAKYLPQSVVEELERILATNPEKLTPEDRGFLRARSFYLTDGEIKKYSVLMRTAHPDKKK